MVEHAKKSPYVWDIIGCENERAADITSVSKIPP